MSPLDLDCAAIKEMKNKSGKETAARGSQQNHKPTQGRTGIVVVCLLALIGAALAYWVVRKGAAQSPSGTKGTPAKSPAAESATAAKPSQVPSGAASVPAGGGKPAPAKPGSTEVARQLIATLSQFQPGQSGFASEQADSWRQTLQNLGEQHAAAVPAIREFLQKNADVTFNSESDRSLLGFPSLRVALLQTLQGIGGPEVVVVFVETLKSAADPIEIATIARSLEQAEPGKHREEILKATREALSVAAAGNLEGRDVGPLMETLKQFDGAETVSDLQKLCSNWFLYTPMILAQLPDGAGVPALIAWAKNPDSPVLTGNDMYLRMLAQVSGQRPDAFEALVEQATAGRIPNSAWNGIAAALGGYTLELANPATASAVLVDVRRFHIAAGNQNFIELPPPDNITPLQAGDRVRMLDRMLGATTNQAALETLQKVRVAIAAKTK
jgi:hypothetical protein